MANRRTKRAPGVWQLKKDVFEIRVRATCPSTGKRRTRWRRFQGTLRQAVLHREELRVALEAPTEHGRAGRERLRTYAKSWFAIALARGDLADSTSERYATALDKHILPALGDIYLDALGVKDVERLMAAAVGNHAPATVNGWRRVLVTVLTKAVREGLVEANVALLVAPLKERDDPDANNSLEPVELRRYLAAWLELFPEFHPLLLALVLTGARWSEVTALTWDDVDDARNRGALLIRRSQYRGKVKETKTSRRRLVPFPTVLDHALRSHRQELVAMQHCGLDRGIVFPSTTGGYLANGRLSAENQKVLRRAGITRRVTIHGLRSSATDLLRLAGVDRVTATAIIGHSTDRMRQHYSQVRPDETRDAGDRVLRLLAPEE